MEAPQTQLPKTLNQFKTEVWTVAISPREEHIAVGLDDGTVEIWDLLTGEKSVSCIGHTEPINSVAFSPNGNILATGSYDNTVRLWDISTGENIAVLAGHRDSVRAVLFNNNGNTIISGSDDNTLCLWDVTTGEPIVVLAGHKDSITSLAFSYENNTLISSSYDHTLRLWDINERVTIQTFIKHKKAITTVAFSPDSKMIASGSEDNTILLWDLQGETIGKPLVGHTKPVMSVVFSPDGSTLASCSKDNTVRLWDISDLDRKRQIIIGQHEGEVYSLVFDAKGNYIISAGQDGIRFWLVSKFNLVRTPQAFKNDEPRGEDSLNVAKELYAIADVLMLRSLEPPLAVAILGGWGSGKSFGLHLIKQQITKIRCQQLTEKQTWGKIGNEPNLSPFVGHIYQIEFNAWSYAKSDLWASLMQTIFSELDRQLTLEKKLGEYLPLLTGGEIWSILNDMNDNDRKTILESTLASEVFAKFKEDQVNSNALWNILSEVRKEEQKKLKQLENQLQELHEEMKLRTTEIERQFDQNLDQLDKEFKEEVRIITENVNQETEKIAILIVFLSQLKETLKDDLGDSILKDFLNSCGFKNRQDLERQFPILNLDTLSKSNIIDIAQELIISNNDKIDNIIINAKKINHFIEEQPIKIVGLIEFIKKDKTKLILFIIFTTLPFLTYGFIVYVLPKFMPALLEISSALKIWLASVSSIPAISVGIEIFKQLQILQAKTIRLLQVARENVENEKQKLATHKQEKIEEKINKRKSEYEENQLKRIKDEKEKAQQQLTTYQKDIENLQITIKLQKQKVGLTAQYRSLLEFVNNRLQENSYQKYLGLMHQIQEDLKDLSDHLTAKTPNTEKLAILKQYFPRGPARIVLYIDDLDRCPPDRVVQVLEAVQLLLNTDIFVIILAIDDRYVSRALETIYRGVLKRGGSPSGVDYLEKIIQIPYRMRPINKEITENYIKSLLEIEEQVENHPEILISSQQQTYQDDLLQSNIGSYPSQILRDMVINEQEITETKQVDHQELPHLKESVPLIVVEKFTAEEFAWIKECCQHVDLTPRTAKRLINICKILKIIWTSLPDDTTWKPELSKECKQTLIAFLALAGRYPKEMRKLLEEIYLDFEESDANMVILKKETWLHRLQQQDVFMDRHNQREWKKFKNDFMKMSPQQEFYFEKRTFNLAVSFCFVGDLGYDPDDYYNREYRYEDGKKQYGFLI
ncbi:hypothetical protein H6F32_06350 [Anabaena sp. FACHB-1237]|uniref:P-loop NTPase fold protein n=1 Tax=Anabaena sp. FACHB-1237 TaxID=2692769 RepID=UPI001681B05C|nr:P-loop NTPase fold protein [Anabaena sp. FACHB-1237]MBD2137213.1 hypothetical protein [Anabaena sp. FACHB-1237]